MKEKIIYSELGLCDDEKLKKEVLYALSEITNILNIGNLLSLQISYVYKQKDLRKDEAVFSWKHICSEDNKQTHLNELLKIIKDAI